MPIQEGWSQSTISGQPVEAFSPAGAIGTVIMLNRESEAWTVALAKHRLAAVVPLAECWWSKRPEEGFEELGSPERFLLERVLPLHRIQAVAGTGIGGQAALRLAFKYPDHFPIAASLNGAIDFHEHYGQGTSLDTLFRSREAARQDTATLQVRSGPNAPEVWFACFPQSEWFRGNDRLREKLNAIGVAHTSDLESSPKGNFDAMMAFIATAIRQRARRLL